MPTKTPPAPEKRGRGRPRRHPDGATKRNWFATDAEYERLRTLAIREGMTVPELVRARVLSQ